MKATDKQPKPVAPIQQKLRLSWGLWLVMGVVVHPVILTMITSSDWLKFFSVQLLAYLPALIGSIWIWHGKKPYALIVLSFVTLIYLGVAGVQLLMGVYQQLPAVLLFYGIIQTVLLVLINGLLFVLLKRLPAMHKNGTTA